MVKGAGRKGAFVSAGGKAEPIGRPRTLCLNMIVRNESKIIIRCLESVAAHVGCWVIGDTGSTDGTQQMIGDFFAERGTPGELHEFAFENFSQARNQALALARASALQWDYVLLTDADMQLMVRDEAFRERLIEKAYAVEQRSGVSYWNNRLLARGSDAVYHGVTHEYLAAGQGTQRLDEIWFVDHASGSNRVEKGERDTRLLTEDLARDPDNPRSHFYLAQTYMDAGKFREAAGHYARRAELGGWAEEAWYALLQQARCLRKLEEDDAFQRVALAAYNARPHRAEPLYELAKFHRQAGRPEAAIMFCEAGLAIPWPEQDLLFVETYVYKTGLQEEYAIAGFYAKNPVRKMRGRELCDRLALGRATPRGARRLARGNIRHYATRAAEIMPSLAMTSAGFVPPVGAMVAMAGMTQWRGQLWMAQMLREAGAARLVLLRLENDFRAVGASDISWPENAQVNPGDVGDISLFVWHDRLWISGNLRGTGGAMLGRIEDDGTMAACRAIAPDLLPRPAQGWMPVVEADRLCFLCSIDPTWRVDMAARKVVQVMLPCAADHLRAAAPPLEFDGGWLVVAKELPPPDGKAAPLLRLMWFDQGFALKSLSRSFWFGGGPPAELALSLAWAAEDRLGFSLVTQGGKLQFGNVSAGDIRALLHPIELRANRSPRPLPPGEGEKH